MASAGDADLAQGWNGFIKQTQVKVLTDIGARHQLTKAKRILLHVAESGNFSDLRY